MTHIIKSMRWCAALSGGSSTYTYLMAEGPGGDAVLIDPVLEMVGQCTMTL
jgi:hypothetical protein